MIELNKDNIFLEISSLIPFVADAKQPVLLDHFSQKVKGCVQTFESMRTSLFQLTHCLIRLLAVYTFFLKHVCLLSQRIPQNL